MDKPRHRRADSIETGSMAQYTPDQLQFLKAMDRYKRDNRRPFPTWCEVLQVLVSLGYRKVT